MELGAQPWRGGHTAGREGNSPTPSPLKGKLGTTAGSFICFEKKLVIQSLSLAQLRKISLQVTFKHHHTPLMLIPSNFQGKQSRLSLRVTAQSAHPPTHTLLSRHPRGQPPPRGPGAPTGTLVFSALPVEIMMENHRERTFPETPCGSHGPLISPQAPSLPSWTWWDFPPSPCSGVFLGLDVKLGAGQPAGARLWTHTWGGVGGCLAPGPRPDFSFHLQIINPAQHTGCRAAESKPFQVWPKICPELRDCSLLTIQNKITLGGLVVV